MAGVVGPGVVRVPDIIYLIYSRHLITFSVNLDPNGLFWSPVHQFDLFKSCYYIDNKYRNGRVVRVPVTYI